jgi:hypothetical protein
MRSHALTLVVILAVLMSGIGCNTAADVPIATMRGAQIVHREIRCAETLASDKDACLRAEQSNLDSKIYTRSIEAAVKLHGIELTESDQALIARHVAAEHGDNVKAASHFRAVFDAVFRLRSGQPAAKVYADAADQGVSAAEIEQMLSQYKTVAEVERALRRDFVAEGDASVAKYYRVALLVKKLDSFVKRRAESSKTERAIVESAFWRDVVAHMELRIVDSRYQMPNYHGVFEGYELKDGTQ